MINEWSRSDPTKYIKIYMTCSTIVYLVRPVNIITPKCNLIGVAVLTLIAILSL